MLIPNLSPHPCQRMIALAGCVDLVSQKRQKGTLDPRNRAHPALVADDGNPSKLLQPGQIVQPMAEVAKPGIPGQTLKIRNFDKQMNQTTLRKRGIKQVHGARDIGLF